MAELKKEIGVLGLASNMVNIIVGAGIFVLPAIVAEGGLGAHGVLAYLFCGFLIATIMLCFAEVGSKVQHPGGPYAYIEVAFGKYAGFICAMLFLTSSVSADAAVSNALYGVLAGVFPVLGTEVFRILIFMILFGGLAAINVMGLKRGIGLVKFITFMKLGPLFILLLVGSWQMDMNFLKADGWPTFQNLGETALILFFAFQGGETGLSVNAEVKNSQKTIPRAILLAISVVLLLYICIQTVAQGILGPELPLYKESPLAEVAGVIFGPLGFTLLTLGAAVSMFGNLSSEVLSVPRALFSAARDKVIPIDILSKLHPKYSSPANAIIIYASIGFTLASLGGFRQLAIISSSAMLLIYLGVSFALIRLRRKKPATKGQFVVPGGLIIPILAIVIIIYFLSNVAAQNQLGLSGYVIFLSLLYFLIKRFSSP